MGVVIAGGLLGLLSLVIKALIDAGSRSRRMREAIASDIELLAKLPEGFAGEAFLRDKIEADLAAYTRHEPDVAALERLSHEEPPRLREVIRNAWFDAGASGRAFFVVAPLIGIAAVVVEQSGVGEELADWSAIAAGAVVLVGVAAVAALTGALVGLIAQWALRSSRWQAARDAAADGKGPEVDGS